MPSAISDDLPDVLPEIAEPSLELPLEFVELTQRLTDGERFRPIAEMRDPDGAVAVITERVTDGRVSFALYREFEKGGSTERTSYLADRHIPGIRRLLNELERRLPGIEDRTRMAIRIQRSRR
jgi:hypothetical protein